MINTVIQFIPKCQLPIKMVNRVINKHHNRNRIKIVNKARVILQTKMDKNVSKLLEMPQVPRQKL